MAEVIIHIPFDLQYMEDQAANFKGEIFSPLV